MKKLLYSAMIFAAPMLCNAQSLPNPGFETWTTDSVNGYMEPTGWNTSNQQTGVFGATVAQNTDAHSGTYSAELSTSGFGSNPVVYYAGVMTNGSFVHVGTNINIVGGTPFTYTPDTVSFWYKYQTGQSDSGRALIYFYKRVNSTTRTLAGFGQLNLSATATFQKANITIKKDTLNTVPDSVLIIFQSCRDLSAPKNGELLVDDLTMGGNTGIHEISEADIQVEVFPNPATSFITINTAADKPAAQNVNVYAADGKLVSTLNASQHRIQVATAQLPAGSYVVKLLWADGSFVHRNIVISK